jgi:aspartate-semialdehyde dehydrogenase
MPRPSAKRNAIAIVGAATLLGKELKMVLEDRNFPGLDIDLFDEDSEAIGVLAEAAGEATFVRGLDEEDFHGMGIVFLASSGARAATSAESAVASGAAVIDLNPRGPLLADSLIRIPNIEKSFPERAFTPSVATANGGAHLSPMVRVPSAPVTIAITLSTALAKLAPSRIAITFFPPVSERGQPGIDELETQTTRLLALQPIVQPLFDAQVAFNLNSRFGAESKHNLGKTRDEAAFEISRYLGGQAITPAVQFIQAPVFYGYAFSAFADFGLATDGAAIAAALREAGIKIENAAAAAPTNISVADDSAIHMAAPASDTISPTAMWLWGAVDHFRMAAVSAVRVAESILAQ